MAFFPAYSALHLVVLGAVARLVVAQEAVPAAFEALMGDEALPGMSQIKEAGSTWLELGSLGAEALAEKTEKCKGIFDKLTEAADTEHDIFNGIRIFATTMKKALDKEDDAAKLTALNKAIALREKFVKAVGMTTKKIELFQQRMKAQKEMMEKAQAEAAAKKAAEGDAGGDGEEEFDDKDEDDEDDKDE